MTRTARHDVGHAFVLALSFCIATVVFFSGCAMFPNKWSALSKAELERMVSIYETNVVRRMASIRECELDYTAHRSGIGEAIQREGDSPLGKGLRAMFDDADSQARRRENLERYLTDLELILRCLDERIASQKLEKNAHDEMMATLSRDDWAGRRSEP